MSVVSGSSEPTQTKRCLDCGETKTLDAFSYSPRGVASRNSYCKVCMRERSKTSYRKRRAARGSTVREARVVPDGQGWCSDCGQLKPLSDFPRNRSGRNGYASYCKPCHNTRGRESRERLYGGGREYHLRARYGIGQADVDRMFAAQRGACAVCRKPDPEHVDHDHRTGRVRGLLCFNCNQALGNVRDNVRVLRELIGYLHRAAAEAMTLPHEEYDLADFGIEYVSAHSRSR